jgi:hypothetical protein
MSCRIFRYDLRKGDLHNPFQIISWMISFCRDSQSQSDCPPPYSFHFTPVNFFSIPHKTAALKGRFQDSEDIKKIVTAELYAGPWDVSSGFSANFRKM